MRKAKEKLPLKLSYISDKSFKGRGRRRKAVDNERCRSHSPEIAVQNINTQLQSLEELVYSENWEVENFNVLTEIILKCQQDNPPWAHSVLMDEIRTIYYVELKSQHEAFEHRRRFALALWKVVTNILVMEKSSYVDKILSFILQISNLLGIQKDCPSAVAKSGEVSPLPLFVDVLLLILCTHNHGQIVGRTRVLDLLHGILKVHHNHEKFLNDMNLRSKLNDMLLLRLRDKTPAVRALSAQCLRFFNTEEVGKTLKYYARFDISPEVRKCCLLSLRDMDIIASRLFYDKAFDQNANVRKEAFIALSSRSIGSLTHHKVKKVLFWGLNQSKHESVFENSVNILMKSWLEECNNDIPTFMEKMDLFNNVKAAGTILDAVVNCKVADDIFKHFNLNIFDDNCLIPIDELSEEKALLWLFLCRKFGDKPAYFNRLVPSGSSLPNYLRRIIDIIHDEHRKAEEEDRDEDGTMIMILSDIVLIVEFSVHEEGTRREAKKTLQEILLDPVLDEAPLILSTIRALFNVCDVDEFDFIILDTVQGIFEPKDPALEYEVSILQDCSNHEELQPKESAHINNSAKRPLPQTPRIRNKKIQKLFESKAKREKVRNELRQIGLMDLKLKLSELILRRMKLDQEKSSCLVDNDYIKANEIAAEMKEFLDLEKATRAVQMEKLEHVLTKEQHIFLNSPADSEDEITQEYPENSFETGAFNQSAPNISHISLPVSQQPISQPMHSNSICISEQGLLKGLLMLIGFVRSRNVITPPIRMLYNVQILSCLSDEDPQTRSCTLCLLYHIARLDPGECRKVMAILIRVSPFKDKAIKADVDINVRISAIKCMTDLLLQYPFSTFRPEEGVEADILGVISGISDVFNDPQASDQSLQEYFLSIINEFCFREPGDEAIELLSLKYEALCKLLMQGRIKSEEIIVDLLSQWMNPKLWGTAVCYTIGLFIPIYTNSCLENAEAISTACFKCVKNTLTARIDQYQNEDETVNFDEMKLLNYICPLTSPERLEEFFDGSNIHEDLFLQVLEEIDSNSNWAYNAHMLKILLRLKIVHEKKAIKAVDLLQEVWIKLLLEPSSKAILWSRRCVKKFIKQLQKVFNISSDEDDSALTSEADQDKNDETSHRQKASEQN